MPSRRRYLAGLAVVLGGCTGPASPTDTSDPPPNDTPDGTPTNSPTPTRTTTGRGTCCYHVIEMRAREATRGEVADAWSQSVDDLPERERAVVEGSLGGETTVEAWRGAPLEAGTYLESSGRYYRVDGTVVAMRAVTSYRFELRVPARGEPDGGPIPYESLTPSERRVVDEGLDGWQPGDSGFGVGYGYVFESTAARRDCRFLDGGTYFLGYEGEVLSIRHDDVDEISTSTYRYSLPRVADARPAFVDLVVEAKVGRVADAGLSGAAADVARDLFTTGHFRSVNPASDAAREVAYWCHDFAAPFGGYGEAYVGYEGALYRVVVEEAMS